MSRKILFAILLFQLTLINAQVSINRVAPPNWWSGMKTDTVELLVYGKNIGTTTPKIKTDIATILQIHKVENVNYLFIDLLITNKKQSGEFNIVFTRKNKTVATYKYKITAKTKTKRGFTAADAIYLIMPDRFSNGDTTNDSSNQLYEKANRLNPDGRHGGDLKGIINHLDYIKKLGMTTLWITPFFENNMQQYSYHGYSITDFYNTDKRLGTNKTYLKLVEKAHQKGLKVIMDVVLNHCGANHWWMNDLPTKDWINNSKDFHTNYRGNVISDIHASKYDKTKFNNGWFVESMPDLNQNNKYLAKYLIQNLIWWIQTSRIDGLRIDTQPYVEKQFMSKLAKQIHTEFPTFTILGEAWLQNVAATAYFQKNSPVAKNYNSHIPCITDFPLCYAIKDALNQDDGWTSGLSRIYYTIASDFLYGDPYNNVIFLDNHDLDRFYSSIGEDITKFKIGIGILFTMRGIPMMFSGDEILMSGFEHNGHGKMRKDFPGGWKNDSINIFKNINLNKKQLDILNYITKLANWRQNSNAIKHGKLVHFIPENNIYTYFRIVSNEAVMVVINNSKTENRIIDLAKYSEILSKYSKVKNIITGKEIKHFTTLSMSPQAITIINLTK